MAPLIVPNKPAKFQLHHLCFKSSTNMINQQQKPSLVPSQTTRVWAELSHIWVVRQKNYMTIQFDFWPQQTSPVTCYSGVWNVSLTTGQISLDVEANSWYIHFTYLTFNQWWTLNIKCIQTHKFSPQSKYLWILDPTLEIYSLHILDIHSMMAN